MWAVPIRCASIRHGRITTDPMTSTQHQTLPAPINNLLQVVPTPRQSRGVGTTTVVKRFRGEDDLKGAAVFLASRASDYVTGQILCVDGDVTAW